MGLRLRYLVVIVSLLAGGPAMAQIFACTAPDGSKVFSDKRCGPDAKVVKGVTSAPKRTTSTSTTKPKEPVTPKSADELEALLSKCNAGDDSACMTWTKGGGPAHLRGKEKAQEVGCEGGSITACEERYCRDGATEECRRRVMPLATLSGDNWYLRFQQKKAADAPALYSIRCLRAGSREIQDVVVSCAAAAGPERCRVDKAQQGFSKLDQAAANSCANPQ